jgi:hypothetical protein
MDNKELIRELSDYITDVRSGGKSRIGYLELFTHFKLRINNGLTYNTFDAALSILDIKGRIKVSPGLPKDKQVCII